MAIIVSPLRLFHPMVAARRPGRIVSLLSPENEFPRADGHDDTHLRLQFNDIVEERPGLLAPQLHHVEKIIAFLRRWDPEKPLFIHCFAGISRSTATALIAAAIHNPDTPEMVIARAMRAASPTAQPNVRIVGFADDILGRAGRLRAAAARLGQDSLPAVEAVPFEIPAIFPTG